MPKSNKELTSITGLQVIGVILNSIQLSLYRSRSLGLPPTTRTDSIIQIIHQLINNYTYYNLDFGENKIKSAEKSVGKRR
jgi:hypothetical protein